MVAGDDGTDTEHVRITNSQTHDINSLLPKGSIYALSLPTINTEGRFFSLSQLAGRIAVVINVACAWGKTALTYGQIKRLLRADTGDGDRELEVDDVKATLPAIGLKSDNIIILAFPTNDFRQEPGSNDQIGHTVSELLGPELYHSPNFILFPKSSLKTNPVYRLLKTHMPQTSVKHNFYKYVIGRNGLPLKFYNKKDDLVEIVTEFKESDI